MKIDSSLAAVITGGASGLGAATARRLAGKGVRVAIFDLNATTGEALAAEIGGVFCEVNVADDAQIRAGFAKARSAHGQERILVNCAGVGGSFKTVTRNRQTGSIDEYPMDNFERVLQINLFGTFRCITQSAAGMLNLEVREDGDRGAIINTASVAAAEGQIGQVAYSASKAAIVGMTLTIARDLSNEAIRVNTIMPGIFETPLLQRLSEDVKARLGAQVPHPKRLGQPEEFAELAETLVSCGYINGEHVRLDGAIRMAPR